MKDTDIRRSWLLSWVMNNILSDRLWLCAVSLGILSALLIPRESIVKRTTGGQSDAVVSTGGPPRSHDSSSQRGRDSTVVVGTVRESSSARL